MPRDADRTDLAWKSSRPEREHMSSQGSNKHNELLDDEMKHEAQPIVQGHGPSHVEEWRQTVSYPDDTDSQEVQDASGIDGRLKEASDDVAGGGVVEAEERS